MSEYIDQEVCENEHGQNKGTSPMMMQEKDRTEEDDTHILRSLETKLSQRTVHELQWMTSIYSIRSHAMWQMLTFPELSADTIQAMIKALRASSSKDREEQRLDQETSNDAFEHIIKTIGLQILAARGRPITGVHNFILHHLSKLDESDGVLSRNLLKWELSRLEFHLAYLLLSQNESLTYFTMVSGLVIYCYNAGIDSPITQMIEEYFIDRRKFCRSMHLKEGSLAQEESYRSRELLSTVYPSAVVDFSLTAEKQTYLRHCL